MPSAFSRNTDLPQLQQCILRPVIKSFVLSCPFPHSVFSPERKSPSYTCAGKCVEPRSPDSCRIDCCHLKPQGGTRGATSERERDSWMFTAVDQVFGVFCSSNHRASNTLCKNVEPCWASSSVRNGGQSRRSDGDEEIMDSVLQPQSPMSLRLKSASTRHHFLKDAQIP